MSNSYNANIYFKTSDLNNIENQIEEITEDIRENVFDNTDAYLRNIQVGDNLGGKTLYLSFPRDTHTNIPTTDTATHLFIAISNNDTTVGVGYKYYTDSNKAIGVRVKNKSSDTGYILQYLYSYSLTTDNGNPYLNYIRFTLPLDYGVVTSIDSNNTFYQHVKIYDETVIPNYTKHRWYDNELLTMQKIDNIEQGIKNIGYYYEKPDGWVNEKEWLGTNSIEAINRKKANYGVGVKTISYQDLNRWCNNLELITFDDLNNTTIWNAKNDITQLIWNEDSDVEWIDGFRTAINDLIGG